MLNFQATCRNGIAFMGLAGYRIYDGGCRICLVLCAMVCEEVIQQSAWKPLP